MKKLLARFLKDERGLELSEYAIMAALIIVVAAGTITLLGESIDGIFTTLEQKITGTEAATDTGTT